jgi:murein DD-endopeptidase MepM/ murein hydrolase activator NlpD
MVRINHGSGWQTLYLHMIEAPPVGTGQSVQTGQPIGRVGSTGDSRRDHLHHEQLRDGGKVESWFNGVPSGITSDGSADTGPIFVDGPASGPVNVVSRNGCASDRPGVYRPSTRTWYRYGSTTFGPYGEVGDSPVTGRWR